MNADDGGVFEMSARFHAAVPALNHPAFSPTRGSGLGAVVDMLMGDGEPACVAVDDDELAHAAAASTPTTNEAALVGAALDRMFERRTLRTSAMCDSGGGAGESVRGTRDAITDCVSRTPWRRA